MPGRYYYLPKYSIWNKICISMLNKNQGERIKKYVIDISMLNRINLRKIVDQISLCSLVWIPFTQIQIPTLSNKNPRQCSQKKPSPYQPTPIILQKSQPHGITSLSTTQPHLKSLRSPTTLPKNKSNPKQCSQKTSHQPCLQIKPKNHQENLPLIKQHQ